MFIKFTGLVLRELHNVLQDFIYNVFSSFYYLRVRQLQKIQQILLEAALQVSLTLHSTTTEETSKLPPGDADSATSYFSRYTWNKEDLIVNVGDRVFFGYDSAELDADAQELLQASSSLVKAAYIY